MGSLALGSVPTIVGQVRSDRRDAKGSSFNMRRLPEQALRTGSNLLAEVSNLERKANPAV